MQIYKYMDIGTAKVTEEEKEILKKGKNIIIIGGTRIICKQPNIWI